MRAALDIALFLTSFYNYMFGKKEEYEPDEANPNLEDIEDCNPGILGYQKYHSEYVGGGLDNNSFFDYRDMSEQDVK